MDLSPPDGRLVSAMDSVGLGRKGALDLSLSLHSLDQECPSTDNCAME